MLIQRRYITKYIPMQRAHGYRLKTKRFPSIDNSTEFWMSDVKWFSSLENTGWLDIIRSVVIALCDSHYKI